MIKINEIPHNVLQTEVLKELARRKFFYFCHITAPDFYKEDRAYLVKLCDEMQDFYESDDEVLIVNVPPRHGKSRTASEFSKWIFGKNPHEKIMTGSYNERLSTNFSKSVRNGILEQKADPDKIVYNDIFPKVRIKKGDGAMNLWALEGSYANYLATSPTGTATGFGASLLLIDDLVKNSMEAHNENVLDKHWEWFCFVGDTKVKTLDGDREIKDIRNGDKILTFNHSQCKIEEKEVVRVGNRLSTIYRLGFENGEEIECTENHQFYTNQGYKSVEEVLSIMRCTLEEGETILFDNLPEQSESRQGVENEMFNLSEGNTGGQEKQTDEILFYGLSPRISSERSGRSLCEMGEFKRVTKGEVQKMPKVRENYEFACSSHRSQYKEQRIGQFNRTVPIVPYKISQITRLPQCELRRVYDIEVSDNHNFFANGMLVHNCNTMLSRLEEGGKIIIIMTRWANGDLAGRALKLFTEEGKRLRHINMKALQDDGTMLCEEVLSRRSFESKKRAMGEDIAMANYQQQPLDLKGILYTRFSTYEKMPDEQQIEIVLNYTDTADTGADYLVSIVGAVANGCVYVKDIICTQDAMEKTEPLVAKQLTQEHVDIAYIESNSGGRAFSRNVERIAREEGKGKLNNDFTTFRPFHQSENKKARILSNSTTVMRFVLYPEGWEERWPEYYKQISVYQRAGQNAHDDAADAITGLVEKARPYLSFERENELEDVVTQKEKKLPIEADDEYYDDFDDYDED